MWLDHLLSKEILHAHESTRWIPVIGVLACVWSGRGLLDRVGCVCERYVLLLTVFVSHYGHWLAAGRVSWFVGFARVCVWGLRVEQTLNPFWFGVHAIRFTSNT